MKRLVILTTSLLGFVLSGLIFPAFSVSALVIDTPASNNFHSLISEEEVKELNPKCCDPETGKCGTYLGAQTGAIVSSGQKLFSGDFAKYTCAYKSGTLKSLVDDSESTQGLMNITASISTTLLNQRPVSTQDYIQDKVYALSGKVSAADPAPYYPGPGTQLLEPIQSFWGWSVNVVMSFLILIVIGIAFAIVFRQKIGGKEIVQIQNAIPSIAMAMILVPLSYAISGVFIDLISLGTNAIHSFFFAPGAPARTLYEDATAEGSVECENPTGTTDDPCQRGLYADDYRMEVWNIRSLVDISDEIEGVANSEITGTGTIADGNGINSFIIMDIIRRILDLISGTTRSPAYWLGEIVNFAVGILMIWIGIKIAWRLLKAYATLVLYPIVSPFIFALVAVPGNSTKTIADYAKTMLGASLMYIVTYAMFLLTFIFTSGVLNSQIPNFQRGIFTPPLLGLKSIFDSIPEGSSRSLTDIMFAFIGLVVYFAIPKTLDDINAKFGGKMSLPSLLTNAADSFKESWNVTTKGAPAVAARATQLTLRGGRGLASGAVNLPYNIRKQYDKAVGLSDNDPRSATYQRRQANLKRRQQLLAQLDATEGDPNKLPERRRIQAQLALLDAQEGLQGKEFSSKAEEGKRRRLVFEMKYATGTDSFVFTQQTIKELYRKLFIDGGNYQVVPIGTLLVKAENISLDIQETLVFGGVTSDETTRNEDIFNSAGPVFNTWEGTDMDKEPTSTVVGDPIFGNYGAVKPPSTDVKQVVDYFETVNGVGIDIIAQTLGKSTSVQLESQDALFRIRALTKPKETANQQNRKVERGEIIGIPLGIVIESSSTLFEGLFGRNEDPANKMSNFVGGALANPIQTSKFAVKIPAKGVSSGSFRLKISKSA